MSVKVMGEVWGLDLPPNVAHVLLAFADHADHDGRNAFPRLPLIAWKTGYSVRQVRRIVANLRDMKVLVPMGQTPHGVVVYRIELGHVPHKPPPEEGCQSDRGCQIDRGDKLTPVTGDTHNHQISISKSKYLPTNSYLHSNYTNSQKNRECQEENPFADDLSDSLDFPDSLF